MPTWKKLVDTTDNRVDVNMDNVAYVAYYSESQSEIHFNGGGEPLLVQGSIAAIQDNKSSSAPFRV